MMAFKRITKQSDILGTLASSLCLLHCIATPLFFALDLTRNNITTKWDYLWWGSLDILFIGISLFAVFWSAKSTTKNRIKYALWMSWGLLATIIINEKLHILKITEELIYLPSIGLIFLHIYNRNYCQCTNKSCCLNEE